MNTSAYRKFIFIAGFYSVVAVLLFSRFELTTAKDLEGYQEVAQISILSREFWTHWRAATIVLLIKLTGDDINLISIIQLSLNLAAWLFFASVVTSFLENRILRPICFATILFFSLGIDFFVWNKVILTESLDSSLILLFIALLMLLQKQIRNGIVPSVNYQLPIAACFASVIFLWGFSRPGNYFNSLLLVPLIGIASLVWWHKIRRWWLVLGVILISLAGIYLLRNYLVSYAGAWRNAFMNNIAANILVDEEKTEFFVERGMPNRPEALQFRGYVPANRAGDWNAVFGDWIDSHGQSAYMEYLILTAPDRTLEAARAWRKVVDPNMTTDLYGRKVDFDFSSWQLQNAYIIYNPGGVTFLALGVMALLLMLPTIANRELDWRWLIPLLMILSTLPMALLNLNADAYEARHHTANSLKLRLGVLLLIFYGLDNWLTKPSKSTFQKSVVVSVGVLFAIEILLGYTLIRDRLSYPLATAIFPNTNILQYREIDDDSYRIFQHIELNHRVLKLQTDSVENEAYLRAFLVRWGDAGVHPELFQYETGTAYVWRNTPQPIAVAGPKGAVYGPIPLDEQVSSDFVAWQERRLPGLLHSLDIDYVYIKASAWPSLKEYERWIFENPDVYELVWQNDDRLYRVKGQQKEWVDFAGDNLGMSASTFAAYQASESFLPADAVIFNPATGALANKNAILQATGALIEATQHSENLFPLMHVLEQMQFQEDFSGKLGEWRLTKQPAILREAGIEYIAFSETWFTWLTTEEQALFENPDLYELVFAWQTELPVHFYLYRVRDS